MTIWIIEYFHLKTKRNRVAEIKAREWIAAITLFYVAVGRVPIVGIRPK